MKKRVLVVAVVAMIMIGCGGSHTSPLPAANLSIAVSPVAAAVVQGGTQQFTAYVGGSVNTAVIWSVREPNGGSITPQGVYTAPNASGIFHVAATSVADASRSQIAEIAVPDVAIQVSPANATIGPGTSESFTATVSGTVNRSVSWAVQEGGVGGQITASGSYSAPPATGTYHVIARSDADQTKSATAKVNVAAINVTVSPAADTLGPSGTRRFSAVLTSSSDAGVRWWLYESIIGGTIDRTGLYTAGQQLGDFQVIASSVADDTHSGSATVRVVPDGFRSAGALSTPRIDPRATLLRDGTVLLSGGYTYVDMCGPPPSEGNILRSEIFDPARGVFSPAATMQVPRSQHTATLLNDGRVLIAGGTSVAPITSAEIYDPATGAFTLTGSMAVARQNHTATLLQNGKVLIAGGYNNGATASAELYDPSAGTFSPTGSMAYPRANHTATLLPNGKVLIAGAAQTAELYDPASGTFSATGTTTAVRINLTATLLADGAHVLLAGGSDGNHQPMASAEIYDVVLGSFTPVHDMLFPRSQQSATLLSNGQVLIAGGTADVTLPTAELFDPTSSTFTRTGSMATARTGYAAVLLQDGRTVLVAGGASIDSGQPIAIATAELYH